MAPENESDIVFNLTAFKRRAERLAESQGKAFGTISKALFRGDNSALRKIMDPALPDDEKTFPRLDTLLRADRELAAIEKELGLVEA